MGKYQKLREIIREVMKDGKSHTPEELEMICKMNGVDLKNNRGPIYNTVHQLKQKGEIISDGENGYISITEKEMPYINLGNVKLNKTTNVDLSDFEVIKPAVRRKTKQIISVFENGDIAFNEELVKQLATKECEIRIKKDCSQLILLPNGEEKLEIGKNSRFKNYEINEKLKHQKIKFPVYYIGEWNENKEFWLGDLSTHNPNKRNFKGEK